MLLTKYFVIVKTQTKRSFYLLSFEFYQLRRETPCSLLSCIFIKINNLSDNLWLGWFFKVFVETAKSAQNCMLTRNLIRKLKILSILRDGRNVGLVLQTHFPNIFTKVGYATGSPVHRHWDGGLLLAWAENSNFVARCNTVCIWVCPIILE